MKSQEAERQQLARPPKGSNVVLLASAIEHLADNLRCPAKDWLHSPRDKRALVIDDLHDSGGACPDHPGANPVDRRRPRSRQQIGDPRGGTPRSRSTRACSTSPSKPLAAACSPLTRRPAPSAAAAHGLSFADGIALSADGQILFVAETSRYRV